MGKWLAVVLGVWGVGALVAPTAAFAQDQAIVSVGGYAEPPPPPPAHEARAPLAVDPGEERREDPPAERYRSPLRFDLGPVAGTTGRGVAPGLGVAADFGTGTVGFRLAAAWLRGEPSGGADAPPSPIVGGLSQYTAELTLDLQKRGPVHPVFGLGFGFAKVHGDIGSGTLGIGTARLGLEYALNVEDADVRLAAGLTGVLPGPADASVQDVRGWVVAGLNLGVGF